MDAAIFVPDLVMVVQKFTRGALSPAQRLLHADAFHFKSHLRVVPIQKFCCSRGERRKKAVAGHNFPWAPPALQHSSGAPVMAAQRVGQSTGSCAEGLHCLSAAQCRPCS